MKPSNRHIHILLGSMAVALVAFDTMAQQPQNAQQQSTSSAIIRRAREDARNDARKNASGVTERMQQFYEEPARSDADAQWMKIVYRQVDLDKVKNAPLYYPEEIIDGQENLFRIIMRLVADGQLDGYEYLDGREIFNDQYRIKVRDMLDRFHIIYTEAKGSTEKIQDLQLRRAMFLPTRYFPTTFLSAGNLTNAQIACAQLWMQYVRFSIEQATLAVKL